MLLSLLRSCQNPEHRKSQHRWLRSDDVKVTWRQVALPDHQMLRADDHWSLSDDEGSHPLP